MKKLPWIEALSAHIGLREIKGAKHEPVIVGWLNAMGGYTGEEKAWWREDESSWCALAVGHALGSTGRYVVKQWYRARAWADPDKMTKLEKPAYGCIVVFSRQGGGHVGFVVGKDKVGRLMVLGGNQGDAVNVKPFGLDRVLGYYWPSSWIGGGCVKSTPDPERYDLALRHANGVPSSTNEA